MVSSVLLLVLTSAICFEPIEGIRDGFSLRSVYVSHGLCIIVGVVIGSGITSYYFTRLMSKVVLKYVSAVLGPKDLERVMRKSKVDPVVNLSATTKGKLKALTCYLLDKNFTGFFTRRYANACGNYYYAFNYIEKQCCGYIVLTNQGELPIRYAELEAIRAHSQHSKMDSKASIQELYCKVFVSSFCSDCLGTEQFETDLDEVCATIAMATVLRMTWPKLLVI